MLNNEIPEGLLKGSGKPNIEKVSWRGVRWVVGCEGEDIGSWDVAGTDVVGECCALISGGVGYCCEFPRS